MPSSRRVADSLQVLFRKPYKFSEFAMRNQLSPGALVNPPFRNAESLSNLLYRQKHLGHVSRLWRRKGGPVLVSRAHSCLLLDSCPALLLLGGRSPRGDRITGARLGARYWRRSDCRSLCATYPAARLSPCQLRRNSIMSQPRSVRGMLIPCRKRKYRRGPLRKASAAPATIILSASSWLTWATSVPSYRRTGVPSGFARLIGGAV